MDIEAFKLLGAATLVIPAIFFVGFVKAMADPPVSRYIAGIVAIAFAIGLWGRISHQMSPLSAMAFLVPAFQYGVFRVMYAAFVRQFRRSPRSAVFNFTPGILADRLFNVVFFIISVLVPLFTVAYMFRPPN